LTRKIAIAVHEGVQALDVAGPVDVFAEANGFVPREMGYETLLVAASREPIRASNGMRMIADLTFEEAGGAFDIALVAGGPALPEAAADPRLTSWLRNAPDLAGLYGSICTGAFALGHAGLLDGRMVTTHWQNAQQLAARFPAANVVPDRIYIRDGRMVTSAGVSAGIDLALSLVGEHHGPKTAVAVAKRLVVVAQRQGGQSQFSPYLAPVSGDSPIARIQVHVMARLAERHTLRRTRPDRRCPDAARRWRCGTEGGGFRMRLRHRRSDARRLHRAARRVTGPIPGELPPDRGSARPELRCFWLDATSCPAGFPGLE